MKRVRKLARPRRAAWALAALLLPGVALARPLYFDNLVAIYGFAPGDDLHACGVCHQKWEGTGGRNPYGLAVEQQLYLGKTIADAILAVEGDDTDGDGFSNVDELSVWGTLPGYSCSNYLLAINPPANFQSLITPGVASCLEPKDILVEPTIADFLAEVGKPATFSIAVRNNGTDFDLNVSSYSLLAGTAAAFSVSGPAAPFAIPVGQSVTLDVTFAPAVTGFASGTLRIESDDPDEPTIDVTLSGLGFVKSLAPASERQACRRDAQRRFGRLVRTSLKEWGRCYLDELEGVACDTGRRDLKIAQAEAKLRAALGGARDRRCAGKGLTPSRIDLPAACGAPCQVISLGTMADWADCLVCREQAAADALLQATVGAAPPDLPPAVLGGDAHACAAKVVAGVTRSIGKLQRKLGACETANVVAASPADCAADLASVVADERAKADALLDRCRDTTGMAGCRFETPADPACLGAAAEAIATDLVDAVFSTD